MNLFERRRGLIKSAVGGLVKLIVTAASGIVSFVTNVAMPTKVTCEFSPDQDLHGMPNPYPAGSSVNLIPDGTDTSNGYIAGYYLNSTGGTTASANWSVSEYFAVDPTKTYTWSCTKSTSNQSIGFYDSSKGFISAIPSSVGYPYTFQPPTGAAYCRASQTTIAYQNANPTGTFMQIEEGSTATAYRRYSNICPINGWAECSVISHEAEYQFDQITWTAGKKFRANGTTTNSNPYSYTETYQDISGCTLMALTLSGDLESTALMIIFYNENNQYLSSFEVPEDETALISDYTAWRKLVDVPSGCKYIRWSLRTTKKSVWHFYKANVIPVNWEDDAGTVYGGTLTINEDGTGTLVSNAIKIVLDGSTNKFTNNSTALSPDHTYYFESNSGKNYGKTSAWVQSTWGDDTDLFICSHGKTFFQGEVARTGDIAYSAYISNMGRLQPRLVFESALGLNTLAKANTYLAEQDQAGTPVEVMFPMKTPVTYNLTASQVNSIIGTNSIWHDMNGGITVEYYNKQ